jgi:hypothetical protein
VALTSSSKDATFSRYWCYPAGVIIPENLKLERMEEVKDKPRRQEHGTGAGHYFGRNL